MIRRPDPPESVWLDLLVRARAGASIRAMCTGVDGMPTSHQLWLRMRADPTFGAEVRRLGREAQRRTGRRNGAQSRGDAAARQRAAFANSNWDRVLERIRAGESARNFCDGCDGMPTVAHYWAYVRSHPEYRARVDAAQEGRRGAKPTAAKADRYLKAAEASNPTEALRTTGFSYSSVKRLVRVSGDFNVRYRGILGAREAARTSERMERVAIAGDRVVAGVPPTIAVRGLGLDYKGIKRGGDHPELARFSALVAQRHQTLRTDAVRRHLPADEVYGIVNREVANLHPQAREEVRSEIILALFEGEIELKDVPRLVRSFTSDFYQRYADRRSVPMDAQLFEDGFASLGDRLADASAFDADNFAFTSFASRVA